MFTLYGLFGLVAVLIVVGVILWAVSHWPGLDPTIVQIIRVVVIVFVALWLLGMLFGAVPFGIPTVPRR